ncbi:MAG: phosphate ABC transporter permease PstA [Candidatus Coproplasma sp.]
MAETKDSRKRFSKENLAEIFNKENIARAVFIAFAAFSILAVFAIVFFVLYESVPALREIGFFHFLFGDVWQPTLVDKGELAASDGFGILPMIVTSLVLTVCSVALGGTLAIFTAVFIVYYCPKCLKGAFTQVINLLAGIPSIVYGFFGLVLVKTLFENWFGVTNGKGLLLSTVILSIMILPTITSIARNSLENVPMHYYEGSLALGNTKNQTVWKVCVPAAKNGIISAVILGIGRAVGETMAVQLLLGNNTNYPTGLFIPIRSLTSNIVLEFSYSSGLHRQALIATGFILLILILIINMCLWAVKQNDAMAGNRLFTRKFREGQEKNKVFSYRKTGSAQDVLWILSCIIAVLVAAVLAFLVVFVLVNGVQHLSWDFLFGQSSNAHATLLPAFATTGLIILISLLIALPLGIGAAIYLTEYAKRGSKFVKVVRLFIDTLAGVPSIVFGLFGAILFGSFMGLGYSVLGGALTMVLIILPTIIRSTEQSLSEVPDSMREASLALGASKVRTIFVVVLPQALQGIITSVILSIGRIVGESAALIFTAGSTIKMPRGLTSPGSTFAVLMFKFMSEGLQINEAYATATVLIIFVIILNLLVSLVQRLFNRGDARADKNTVKRKKKTHEKN